MKKSHEVIEASDAVAAAAPVGSASPVSHCPIITSLEWGHIKTTMISGKDLKLYPGGGRAWDWSETGTRHQPGIQPADTEELIAHGASTIILSRGMDEVLQTCPQTFAFLEQKNIQYVWADTRTAVQQYNQLAERGELVGGLFHSTC